MKKLEKELIKNYRDEVVVFINIQNISDKPYSNFVGL